MGSNVKKDSDERDGRRQCRSRQGQDSQQRLSASAHISREQIEGLFLDSEYVAMPVIQEEDRVPLVIDVSILNEEELDELRITDPFMYYSIPSARNAFLRGSTPSAQGSANLPSGRQVQHLRRSAPAAMLNAAADAATTVETQVRRRSRISFELSFDAVMSDIIESITDGGLDLGGGDDGDDTGDVDESYGDFLDWLGNSSNR
jgi:hypothetical protein